MRNLLIISKFLSFCSVFCSVNSPTFTLLVQSDTNWESMVIGPPYLLAINTLDVSCLVLSWVLFGKGSRGLQLSDERNGHFSRGIVSFPLLFLPILLFIRKSNSLWSIKDNIETSQMRSNRKSVPPRKAERNPMTTSSTSVKE